MDVGKNRIAVIALAVIILCALGVGFYFLWNGTERTLPGDDPKFAEIGNVLMDDPTYNRGIVKVQSLMGGEVSYTNLNGRDPNYLQDNNVIIYYRTAPGNKYEVMTYNFQTGENYTFYSTVEKISSLRRVHGSDNFTVILNDKRMMHFDMLTGYVSEVTEVYDRISKVYSWAEDGNLLFYDYNGYIHVYNFITKTDIELTQGIEPVVCDSTMLYKLSEDDQRLRVMNWNNPSESKVLGDSDVGTYCFTADGRYAIYTARSYSLKNKFGLSLKLWDFNADEKYVIKYGLKSLVGDLNMDSRGW